MSLDAQIRHNKKVHDAVASSYEGLHTEIYNPTEQARIFAALTQAVSSIGTLSRPPEALDFGAGTGNLTGHLLKAGAVVTAADVSSQSLKELKAKYGSQANIVLLELNGRDLSEIPDDTFDLVATYSVLHHVPDYLAAVREFMRVVKPGGVIFIDHEAAPVIWDGDQPSYREYLAELQKAYGPSRTAMIRRKIFNLFSYRAWVRLINRKLFGLNGEGDIHVTTEDHIEWSRIESILLERCDVVARHDYLVCRETEVVPMFYNNYRERAVDIRMLVCRKR